MTSTNASEGRKKKIKNPKEEEEKMEGKRLVWSRVLIASPTPAAENIGIWPNGIKKKKYKTRQNKKEDKSYSNKV